MNVAEYYEHCIRYNDFSTIHDYRSVKHSPSFQTSTGEETFKMAEIEERILQNITEYNSSTAVRASFSNETRRTFAIRSKHVLRHKSTRDKSTTIESEGDRRGEDHRENRGKSRAKDESRKHSRSSRWK